MKGQDGSRQPQKPQMDRGLQLERLQLLQEVGITISEQEHGLEEGQTGVPDRRTAPQQGQHQLSDDGLNGEDQSGAEEYGQGENRL